MFIYINFLYQSISLSINISFFLWMDSCHYINIIIVFMGLFGSYFLWQSYYCFLEGYMSFFMIISSPLKSLQKL